MDEIYGIDLGTSNCLIAKVTGSNDYTRVDCLTADRDTKATFLPSVIHFKNNDETIIGEKAKYLLPQYPSQTIELIKTRIGIDHNIEIQLNNNSIQKSPQELSAFLLKELNEVNNNKIKKAFLTVPADFDMGKKEVTLQVGNLADIEIIGLIEEPSAAIMYYLYDKYKNNNRSDLQSLVKNYLVFDFGGGTLDLSLIKVELDEKGNINPSVLLVDGDPTLGGNLIDLEMCRYLIEEYLLEVYCDDLFIRQVSNEFNYYYRENRFSTNSTIDVKRFILRLKNKIEEAKINLSTYEEVEIDFQNINYENISFSREEFVDDILQPNFRGKILRAFDELDKKNEGKIFIDEALFVGGTSQIPYFKELVIEKIPQLKNKITIMEEYDTAIAKGAAILGTIKAGTPIAPFYLNSLKNTVPHDIFIEHGNDKELVINHGAVYPLEKPIKKVVTIRHSLNTHINLKVFEEKGKRTIKEAEFFHPMFYTGEIIDVVFNIDQHGIISFTAYHPETKESVDFDLDKLFLLDMQEVNEIKREMKQVRSIT
jgi:molecular chaperone DnaK